MKGYFFSVRHMVKYRKTERRDSNALNSSDRFIHIFTQEVTMRLNKENIYTGTSPEIFNRIRSALEVKKIKYEYDIINHNTDSLLMERGVPRSMGGNLQNSGDIFEIYVAKKDKEEAEYYLKSQNLL